FKPKAHVKLIAIRAPVMGVIEIIQDKDGAFDIFYETILFLQPGHGGKYPLASIGIVPLGCKRGWYPGIHVLSLQPAAESFADLEFTIRTYSINPGCCIKRAAIRIERQPVVPASPGGETGVKPVPHIRIDV